MKFKESPFLPLAFSLGCGSMFFVWLFGFLGFYKIGGADNLIFILFQMCFVFPVYAYMTYRLFNLKDRVIISDRFVTIRSIHLVPKELTIPLDIVICAEWFAYESRDGDSNGLRIKIKSLEDINDCSGDQIFGITNGNFECMIGESKSKTTRIANAINSHVSEDGALSPLM